MVQIYKNKNGVRIPTGTLLTASEYEKQVQRGFVNASVAPKTAVSLVKAVTREDTRRNFVPQAATQRRPMGGNPRARKNVIFRLR